MSLKQNLAGLAGVFTIALLATAPAQATQVVKDPLTGELRAPTADEARALQANKTLTGKAAQPRGLLTGRVNPPAVTRPDGTVEQELDDSSLMYSTVTRNADGTLSFNCVQGKDKADAVLKGGEKAAHVHTAKEEKRDEK